MKTIFINTIRQFFSNVNKKIKKWRIAAEILLDPVDSLRYERKENVLKISALADLA
jgi:hypothetical protein